MKTGKMQEGQIRVTLSRQDETRWSVYRGGVREKGVNTAEAIEMALALLSDERHLRKILIEFDE